MKCDHKKKKQTQLLFKNLFRIFGETSVIYSHVQSEHVWVSSRSGLLLCLAG